jgi:hypothetical protein
MRNSIAALALTVLVAGVLTTGNVSAQTAPAQTEQELQQQRDREVAVPTGTLDEAIAKVQEAGLMGGYPGGKFHPERSLTRAQLASILVKTFNLKERKVKPLQPANMKDVPASYWAADDIRTVVEQGVMEGYRAGYFYPEQKVTRAEALAIFAQAYGVQQLDDNTVQATLSRYPDATQIPEWAKKAIVTSLKNGFVDVAPSQQIRPMQQMTRGDMAFALNQYLNRLHNSEQETLR